MIIVEEKKNLSEEFDRAVVKMREAKALMANFRQLASVELAKSVNQAKEAIARAELIAKEFDLEFQLDLETGETAWDEAGGDYEVNGRFYKDGQWHVRDHWNDSSC